MILGLTMLLYGVPLLLPPDEFGQYRVYKAMAGIANETVWGLVVAGIASWRIYAVWQRRYKQRIVATSLSCTLWSFLCALFLLVQPASPGVFLFGLWAFLEFWTVTRIHRTH